MLSLCFFKSWCFSCLSFSSSIVKAVSYRLESFEINKELILELLDALWFTMNSTKEFTCALASILICLAPENVLEDSIEFKSLSWVWTVAAFQNEIGNFSSPVKPANLKSILLSTNFGLSSRTDSISFYQNSWAFIMLKGDYVQCFSTKHLV